MVEFAPRMALDLTQLLEDEAGSQGPRGPQLLHHRTYGSLYGGSHEGATLRRELPRRTLETLVFLKKTDIAKCSEFLSFDRAIEARAFHQGLVRCTRTSRRVRYQFLACLWSLPLTPENGANAAAKPFVKAFEGSFCVAKLIVRSPTAYFRSEFSYRCGDLAATSDSQNWTSLRFHPRLPIGSHGERGRLLDKDGVHQPAVFLPYELA